MIYGGTAELQTAVIQINVTEDVTITIDLRGLLASGK
jgi:hypothetical protein